LDWITAEPVPDMDETLDTLINIQLGGPGNRAMWQHVK
jgi:hypothetical protein